MDTSRKALVCLACTAICFTLQGCIEYINIGNANIPTHSVAFWRQKSNYWERFAIQDKEGDITQRFNSCMDPTMDSLSVCSGRGKCKAFSLQSVETPIWFCQCNDGYGDPDCRTVRKSQFRAWFLSLLFGPFGIDELYLGWPVEAAGKMMVTSLSFVLFGLGFKRWAGGVILGPWLFDVVRIGSAPVRSREYRVADDLPRYQFAMFSLFFFTFIAIAMALSSLYYAVIRRRRNADKNLATYGAINWESIDSSNQDIEQDDD